MLNLDTHILLHAVAGSLTTRELALLRCHPADELIAATSVVHNVPLVTRDPRLRASRIVPLLPARR